VPVADAGGAYSGTEGVAISFDGSGSSDPDGTIVSWLWDFGDGESSKRHPNDWTAQIHLPRNECRRSREGGQEM